MGLLFFSLLGIGAIMGFMDGNDPDPEGEQNREADTPDPTNPEVTPDLTNPEVAPDLTNPEVTTDLLAPEAPTLGKGTIKVTDTVWSVDDGSKTAGNAYHVTANVYDITTGSGDDTLVIESDLLGAAFLGDGDDAVWGGEGRDALRGEAGNDSLYGGGGNDSIVDVEGENSIYGGDGDDFIRASSGSTIVGGDGADSFGLNLSTSAESPLRVLDYDPDMDRLKDIRLYVSDGDIFDLNAVAREDGTGADLMFDGRVLAEVFGASADDLTDIPVNVSVDGGVFTDDDTGRNIRGNWDLPETVFAGGGDDTIHGGPGDLLDAGDGNDLVFAYGQFSQDVSDPSAMSTVQGGPGDDVILSSNGNVLAGGDGADIFGLSLTQYNGAGTGSGFDLAESVITDFNPAQDVVYIEGAFIMQAGGTMEDLEETLSIQVWSSGLGADILVGDEIIARVTGGQTLRVEDLVIAENGLGTDLLGYH